MIHKLFSTSVGILSRATVCAPRIADPRVILYIGCDSAAPSSRIHREPVSSGVFHRAARRRIRGVVRAHTIREARAPIYSGCSEREEAANPTSRLAKTSNGLPGRTRFFFGTHVTHDATQLRRFFRSRLFFPRAFCYRTRLAPIAIVIVQQDRELRQIVLYYVALCICTRDRILQSNKFYT